MWDDVVDYLRSPEYPPYIALEVKSVTGNRTGFPGCKLRIVDSDGCELIYYQLPSKPIGAGGNILYNTLSCAKIRGVFR